MRYRLGMETGDSDTDETIICSLLSELDQENEIKFDRATLHAILKNGAFSLAFSSLSLTLYYQQTLEFAKERLGATDAEAFPLVFANLYGNVWNAVYPSSELFSATVAISTKVNQAAYQRYKKQNYNRYWAAASLPSAALSAFPLALLVKGNIERTVTFFVYTGLNGYALFVLLKNGYSNNYKKSREYEKVLEAIETIREKICTPDGDIAGDQRTADFFAKKPALKKVLSFFSATYLSTMILLPFVAVQIKELKNPSQSLGFLENLLPKEGTNARELSAISIIIFSNLPWAIMSTYFGYNLPGNIMGRNNIDDTPPGISYKYTKVLQIFQSLMACMTWVTVVNLWLWYCEEEDLSESTKYSLSIFIGIAGAMFNLFPSLEITRYAKVLEGLCSTPAIKEQVTKLLQLRQLINRLENLKDNVSLSDFNIICSELLPHLDLNAVSAADCEEEHQPTRTLNTFLYSRLQTGTINDQIPLLTKNDAYKNK